MEGSSAELVCEDSMGALEMASALLTGVGRAPLLGGGIVVVRIPAVLSLRYIKPAQDKEGAPRARDWTGAVVPDLWISKPPPFKF